MAKTNNKKAYVIAVDMGYGHQRAAYPLQDIAEGGIINANKYAGIPDRDRRIWEGGRKFYESISRFKYLPLIGDWIFALMDYLQRILPFYPFRNLSQPTVQVKQIYSLIRKGWGKDLIDRLNKKPLPLISTFFTPAFFAEEHGYQGEIFCLCTDTDIARAWAPLHPEKTKINYLAPNRRVKERLQEYGVKAGQIFITGFPLPKENIGGKNLEILKESLAHRIVHLDPEGRFQKKYQETLEEFLGSYYLPNYKVKEPLSITFAVGGAGAQRELGAEILKSLRKEINRGTVKLNLVAGVRNDVFLYYQKIIRKLHLEKKHNDHANLHARINNQTKTKESANSFGAGVNILYADNKSDYFAKFNQLLLTTDILWTKPSELSFYAGLGLPIIMAPPVGSQEVFNHAWLTSIGAGVDQENPGYTNEWLFDWLKSGWLAEAALHGFLDAPRNGAYHIEEVVLHGKRSEIEDIHLL